MDHDDEEQVLYRLPGAKPKAAVIGSGEEDTSIGRAQNDEKDRKDHPFEVTREVQQEWAMMAPLKRVLVSLSLLSVGAFGALTIFFWNHGEEETQLRGEVERLRDRNDWLATQAALAEQEKDDLAQMILDTKSRDRLTSLMERSAAFEQFLQEKGFEHNISTTSSIRECLGRVLFEYKVDSILDVPSGDGSWQHLVPGIANITYVGGDININALETAKSKRENAEMEFFLFDAVHFPLRRAFDLVLFRDVVEQMNIQDALTALLNFKTSGSKWLAATYWPRSSAQVNRAAYHLDAAGWYETNLQAEPFNFPEPSFRCENDDPGTPHRGKSMLGVWRLKDLELSSQKVRDADPAKHHNDMMRPQKGVHRREADSMPQRHPHIQKMLDEVANAFTPLHKGVQGMRQVTKPFDGLFQNFLETPGTVAKKVIGHGPGMKDLLGKDYRGTQGMSPLQFLSMPDFNPFEDSPQNAIHHPMRPVPTAFR